MKRVHTPPSQPTDGQRASASSERGVYADGSGDGLPRVAALYVMEDGPYAGIPDVDVWGPSRDARTYAGPWPVVAHPPCERWGRYWSGGPSARVRRELGDDGGCFAAALEAVRRWGGVLEHPEASHAWRAFGIHTPPHDGGWVWAGIGDPGWTCCVEQGHYEHKARKKTWLYYVPGSDEIELPSLVWGSSGQRMRLDAGKHRAGDDPHVGNRITARECAETPPAFRDLLLDMARSVHRKREESAA